MNAMAKGLSVQARVVFALALRETRTRFGQHRLGYVWALLEPVLWVATFYGLYAVAGRQGPNGMALIPFLATGVIAYELAMKTADRVSAAVEGNKALLYYPQVTPLDLAIARGGLEFATYGVIFVILLGGYALYEQRLVIHDILLVIEGMGLAVLFGTTLGLVLCSLAVSNNAVQRIKGPVMRPLFWISGLFFAANSLPSKMREYFLWNPILHCVELVRDGWFREYHATHARPGYVLTWIVLLAFVGLTLERRVRPHVQLS